MRRAVELHPAAVETIQEARDWCVSRDATGTRALFSEITPDIQA